MTNMNLQSIIDELKVIMSYLSGIDYKCHSELSKEKQDFLRNNIVESYANEEQDCECLNGTAISIDNFYLPIHIEEFLEENVPQINVIDVSVAFSTSMYLKASDIFFLKSKGFDEETTFEEMVEFLKEADREPSYLIDEDDMKEMISELEKILNTRGEI